MRLIRMELNDFRGVHRSTVEFSDGLTVVEGPNEIGKSSIPEAFRLLREYKSTSKAGAVKAVQPVGRDVGPEATVTVAAGPYTMRYRKRWLVGALTELKVEGAVVEQLSGLPAHERFEQILAETVDLDLLKALDVGQGKSLDQASLADIPAVHKTLQEQGSEDEGEHTELLAAIDDEYALYFTAGGRPTKDYAATAQQVADLESKERELVEEAAASELLAEQHARAMEALAELREKLVQAVADEKEAGTKMVRVNAIRARLEAAVADQAQAEADLGGLVRLQQEREALKEESQQRAIALGELETEIQRSETGFQLLAKPVLASQEALKQAQRATDMARKDVQVAQETLDVRRQSDRVDDLQRLLDKVVDLEEEIARARARAASQSLTEDAVSELSELDSQLHIARAAAGAAAPRVTVTRTGNLPVQLGAQQILEGESETALALARTTVTVPGIVEVVVEPGETDKNQARVESAQQAFQEALDRAEVSTLAQAQKGLEAKLVAQRREEQLVSNLELLLDGRESGEIRLALETARASLPKNFDASESSEIEELERALEHAKESLVPLEEETLEQQEALNLATKRQSEAREEIVRLREKHRGLDEELGRVQAKLVALREDRSDDALLVAQQEAETFLEEKKAIYAELAEQLEREGPESLEADAEYALATVRTHEARVQEARTRYDGLSGRIEQVATAGTYTRLETVRSDLEALRAKAAALHRQAEAVRMLRETLLRHKQEAQEKYVAPFRTAIETLGRPLFGADFSVEIGPDLRVMSRTLGGQTVPFDSLSAGTREQVALLGRLACAQLISPGEGAPLVLDDAFGFSDPARLQAMNRILTSVGGSAQVILLTCQPDRFPKLGDATFVSLLDER